MELTFASDKYHLASLILTTREIKGKKNDTDLKNRLWKKYKSAYQFLQSRSHITINTLTDLQKLLDECIESDNFKRYYKESLEYLKDIKIQWEKNKTKIIKILEDILKIKLPKAVYTVYVTHPKFHKGQYLGDNVISYTHKEDWPYYNMVYLTHEILHSIIPSNDFSHAVIELATDNELRMRLNPDDSKNREYFNYNQKQLIGHSKLHKLELKLLPKWKKYLKNDSDNIYDFINKNLPYPD